MLVVKDLRIPCPMLDVEDPLPCIPRPVRDIEHPTEEPAELPPFRKTSFLPLLEAPGRTLVQLLVRAKGTELPALPGSLRRPVITLG